MKNGQGIKRGDTVKVLESGYKGIIADIQYEFDRYQLTDVSGWQYGIKGIRKEMMSSEERQHRIHVVNQIIQEISKRGRKFLYNKFDNRISYFSWDGQKLWYMDKYKGIPLIMKRDSHRMTKKHETHFSEGGTLWGLVNEFADYIHGNDRANGRHGYDGVYGSTWGYPAEDMDAIVQLAKDLGYLKPSQKAS